MFITNHYMLTFAAAKALGIETEQAAIGSLGAAVNDLHPQLHYFSERLKGRGVAQYGQTYDSHHAWNWLMFVAFALMFGMCLYFQWDYSVNVLFIGALGYFSHIGIDKLWHKPEGGYRSWGIVADIIVGVVLVFYFIRFELIYSLN